MRLDERDHGSLVLWATDCAGPVLPHFEEKHTKDDRPRKAVEAERTRARGEIARSEMRVGAFAARRRLRPCRRFPSNSRLEHRSRHLLDLGGAP